MDAEYYRRQAKQERRRLEGHQKKLNEATAAASKAEAAASKAETAARKASSPSQQRSKLSEAERERRKAEKARDDQTKASKAVTTSQSKINKLEGQAQAAQAKQDKKDASAAEKKERERNKAGDREARRRQREAREAERAARDSARREDARDDSIQRLGERTAEIERRLVTARLQAPETITVLFLAGTITTGADDDPPLRLDREIREIETKLQASTYRDQVKFQAAQATRIPDVLDLLNKHDPDVVHFSGHGNRSSLLFEGSDGAPQSLRADELALFLQAARKQIKLVVFNACLSAAQAEDATAYVNAAIGMEETIDDDSAKTFAGQFYGSLAEGNSLQNSFDQAKAQAIVVNKDPDSGRSVLFARPGIDTETMVLVAPP